MSTEQGPSPAAAAAKKPMSVTQASFIGVGAMVGAGIFALLGAAGAVAGSAVWLSFVIAGAIAALQGYSFAKLGSTYPSSGGMLTYLAKGFGERRITGIVSWLFYMTGAIVAAMVATSFGGYASAVVTGDDPLWAVVFAVLLVVVMTGLNIVGSTAVARVQSVIVKVVLAILTLFAVVTIANGDAAMLDPGGYPGVREIISSVALTFFAFLGFGVITFTAKDLPQPVRQLPRAMYLALGIATAIYVAVSVGVFATLTADEVVAYGATALAEAAKPTLGQTGYVLMVITALLSTAGAVNASLYPSAGMTRHLAEVGQFPRAFGRNIGRRAPVGLVVMAVLTIFMIVALDLNSIASLGSAVALLIFSAVTVAHFRTYRETHARLVVLVIALITTLGTFVVFTMTTLVAEPKTALALVVILAAAVVFDLIWKRMRDRGKARYARHDDSAGAPG
ncbi:APC family permease [Microbacterium sp. W1N]|uniref:APC family permease n=1 Tax=Microbacterium festucae TaxID=2977531 RepID=UPI0021C173BC|nr:APC family permease [Microbacterium festucae]MCT9821074.1 APC family permease [Microbacterium festucae]